MLPFLLYYPATLPPPYQPSNLPMNSMLKYHRLKTVWGRGESDFTIWSTLEKPHQGDGFLNNMQHFAGYLILAFQ